MGYSTNTTTYEVDLSYPTQAAPTTTVNMRAPEHGNGETIDRRQVFHDTAGGDLIVYDRGPRVFVISLSFVFMDRTNRNELEDFFEDDAKGGRRTFEMYVPRYDNLDANGDASGHYHYTSCQFETGSLEFQEIRNGWYSTSFRVRASARATV